MISLAGADVEPLSATRDPEGDCLRKHTIGVEGGRVSEGEARGRSRSRSRSRDRKRSRADGDGTTSPSTQHAFHHSTSPSVSPPSTRSSHIEGDSPSHSTSSTPTRTPPSALGTSPGSQPSGLSGSSSQTTPISPLAEDLSSHDTPSPPSKITATIAADDDDLRHKTLDSEWSSSTSLSSSSSSTCATSSSHGSLPHSVDIIGDMSQPLSPLLSPNAPSLDSPDRTSKSNRHTSNTQPLPTNTKRATANNVSTPLEGVRPVDTRRMGKYRALTAGDGWRRNSVTGEGGKPHVGHTPKTTFISHIYTHDAIPPADPRPHRDYICYYYA
eukprot:TRINITY_DN16142_c0_g1_i1.p1 TRINITY_DN16142_c0_g1~~TRINITY_DN16142_c0_g1_i1.p1  ORF type:complete len:327 (+),score=44.19 TRINITY_DN16142_c0_g1_i1:116-1096(+)